MTFALGVQKHFLPESFLKEIPNSTSYYWKEENSEKYVGAEFAKGIQQNLEDTKVFLDQRLYFSRMAFLQFARLYLTIISLIGKDDFKKLEKICITNRVYKDSKNIKIREDIILKKVGEDFVLENSNKKYLLKRWREKNKSEYDIIDFSKGDFNEVIILKDKVLPLD